MNKFGICSEIFEGWSIEDACSFAAKVGYDAIEIAPFTLATYVTDISAATRERVKTAAARAGIAISGIHWVLAKTEGLHVNHPDAAVRQRTADYCCELVKLCADFGGSHMIVGSPKQRLLLEGVTHEQGTEWARNTWRPALRLAEDRGVTICMEPLTPAETNFLTSAAEAIEFVKPLNSPNFKIILDVRAMHSESKPVPQIIRESWPHFAYFHANDKNDKGPGFGDVDYVPIVAALKEVGYSGYVSVEVFKFEEGPEAIATRSLEYLKRVFA